MAEGERCVRCRNCHRARRAAHRSGEGRCRSAATTSIASCRTPAQDGDPGHLRGQAPGHGGAAGWMPQPETFQARPGKRNTTSATGGLTRNRSGASSDTEDTAERAMLGRAGWLWLLPLQPAAAESLSAVPVEPGAGARKEWVFVGALHLPRMPATSAIKVQKRQRVSCARDPRFTRSVQPTPSGCQRRGTQPRRRLAPPSR